MSYQFLRIKNLRMYIIVFHVTLIVSWDKKHEFPKNA